jgi:hypothetical protein
MQIIDDDGMLLGRLNVIDALAVLLVLSVVVAGIALVGFGDGGQEETRYVTVDFGAQPDYVTERLVVGSQSQTERASGNLTITDRFVSGSAEGTRLVAMVEVEGRLAEGPSAEQSAFSYAGEELRFGSALNFTDPTYDATGRVVDIAATEAQLDTQTTSARVEAEIPSSVATQLAVGDGYDVAGQRIATILDIRRFPTDAAGRERVSLGVDLETIEDRFSGVGLAPDAQVPLEIGGYEFNGRITGVGDIATPGESRVLTATIELRSLEPAQRAAFEASTGSTSRGMRLDRVVRTEPASVVITSDAGEIFARDHPVLQDVIVEVTVEARQQESSFQFRGERLVIGRELIVDAQTVSARGVVVDIQG